MLFESFKFFVSPTSKWRLFKLFAKLNGNHISVVIFSKLCKYQRFVLIKLHNLSKDKLADRIFKLWKSCVYDDWVVEHIFYFYNFQKNFVKIFTKKPPGFKIDFESTDKVLPLHQSLWSEISWQWNNVSLNFFQNLHGGAFWFLNFVKWGKY